MDTNLMISLVAAVARNGVIGRGGKLPWRLRADLKRFRELTLGHTVITGRKTHEAILARLGHPLPNRRTIILTRFPEFRAEGVEIAHSWEEVMRLMSRGEEVFVIGGAEIYRLSLPYAQRLYLTRIEADVAGDTFFPEWNPTEWRLVSAEPHPRDRENEYDYTFQILERRPENKASFVNLDNARFPEQRAIMERFDAQGLCPFCPPQIEEVEAEPVIRQGSHWHIRKNRWPYRGTRLHFLMIANQHIENLTEILPEAWQELLELIQWIESNYRVKGGGLGLRFGDVSLNGGTVKHLHLHFIAADPALPDYQKVRFAMGPEPPK